MHETYIQKTKQNKWCCDIHMQKNEVGPLPYTAYIYKLKMDQRPERAKTIKYWEENTGGKLHDSGFGNDFLGIGMTPNAQATKEKNR